MRAFSLLVFVIIGLASASPSRSLEGDRVYRLYHGADSAVSVEKVRKLLAELDVWGHQEDGGLDVRAPAAYFNAFVALGVNVTDVTKEVEAHFAWFADNEESQVCTNSAEECAAGDDFYTRYQRMAAIH
jgi:hypothetical protein